MSGKGNKGLTDPRNDNHPHKGHIRNGLGTIVCRHVKKEYRRRDWRRMWRAKTISTNPDTFDARPTRTYDYRQMYRGADIRDANRNNGVGSHR